MPGGRAGSAGCDLPFAPRRIVRLSFDQIANSLESLVNDAAAAEVRAEFEIGDPEARAFPPLDSPREGGVYAESNWTRADAIAQRVAARVFENFAGVTGCEPADDECGENFLGKFMQAAIRRPPAAAELDNVLRVYREAKSLDAPVPEAVRYGVYAVLSSPLFLYRTEFGAPNATERERVLTSYEAASALSFFLADAPPDAELLAAAEADALRTPEDLEPHVDRLLETPRARQNLEVALRSYFNYSWLRTVILDPERYPNFDAELRVDMAREASAFLADTLWSEPVSALLTSRHSRVNASLAELYGVAFPPPGAELDENGFAAIELPAERAGIVTQPAFLTVRSRPDGASIVARGMLVAQTLLCQEMPPFPELIEETMPEQLPSVTDREKAEYRMATAPCSGCHVEFDPYGIALESIDAMGGFRTTDEEGRPIDTAVDLPAALDRAHVADARELALRIAASGRFTACLSKNMMRYALTEGGVDVDVEHCEVKDIVQRYENGSDRTFSGLARQVALSKSFLARRDEAP